MKVYARREDRESAPTKLRFALLGLPLFSLAPMVNGCMASRPSFLNDIETEMPCVDPGRLASSIESIHVKFSACGIELGRPCCKITDTANHCWITWHLPALNEALRVTSMHIFEHVPGKFTLGSFPELHTEYDRPESNLLESVTLVYWLLKEHRCVTRLHLGEAALFFCCFSALLCKVLQRNKGLEQVRFRSNDVRGVWRETRSMNALCSTLGKLSPALDVLDINALAPTEVSLGGIAKAVRRGRLHRLRIWHGGSTKFARGLFRAVGYSSCLCELEVEGTKRLPLPNAAILSKALCRNKTLRKLSIQWLEKDAIGTLMTSLKSNTTLEELTFTYSYDEPNLILWEGFEALRANRSLKSIKLVGVGLINSCALIMADILKDNNVLEEVSLSDNSISDLGASALAKALQLNSTLKRLDISKCMPTYDALSSFVNALSFNNTVECVRLSDVEVPEDWAPSSALTADICARLDVSWNTRGLEDWAKSIRQGQHFPRVCIGWTPDTKASAIVEWFDAMRGGEVWITELIINCPGGVAQDCGEAVASFLENTRTLKKLTVDLDDRSYIFVAAIIRSLTRNKSVTEARFQDYYIIDHLSKALQDLMRTNRTLNLLTFKTLYLKERAVRSLARALEENFVLLTFELEFTPDVSMYPIYHLLDRNQSLLCRAVERVLGSSAEEESIRALRLLSTTDSLLDAVVAASGKQREECRRLVEESVRRL